MSALNLISLIIAVCLFLAGAFLSLGPDDVRMLGTTVLVVSSVLAAAVVIGESIIKSRSGGSR
jgi:hypothetical protein